MKIAISGQQMRAKQRDLCTSLGHIAKGGDFARQLFDPLFKPIAKQRDWLAVFATFRFGMPKECIDVFQKLRIAGTARKVEIADDFVEKRSRGRIRLKRCRAHYNKPVSFADPV